MPSDANDPIASGGSAPIHFPEPRSPDPSFADPGEGYPSWLARSTVPRAQRVRHWLNDNIECIPEEYRSGLTHALRTRWDSALLELVVMRLVQSLGGTFEVEEANADGKRPDLRASFDDATVVIECTAPEFDKEVTREEAIHVPLLQILEALIPAAWTVLLHDLPLIGPAESKKPFKAAVMNVFAQAGSPTDDQDQRVLKHDFPQGTLKMTILPRRHSGVAVAGGPTYGSWSDEEQRIHHGVRNKRRQVRSEQQPVILAILSSSLGGAFDAFDRVLLGHSVSRVDWAGKETESWFAQDGVLANDSDDPTYSGVIALKQLSPFGTKGPVLYLHRRAGDMPSALSRLEVREVRHGGIVVGPSILKSDWLAWADVDP